MSYSLSEEKINEVVTRKSPGSYALGYMDGGAFTVFYVGRSDSDVNAGLRGWIGVEGGSTRYVPSTKAAFGTRPGHAHSLPTPALLPVGIAECAYTHFEFSYSASAESAFAGECCAYHDFGGSYGSLDNPCHPAPPEGAPWPCPVDGPPHSRH